MHATASTLMYDELAVLEIEQGCLVVQVGLEKFVFNPFQNEL